MTCHPPTRWALHPLLIPTRTPAEETEMPYPTLFVTPGVKAFAEAVDHERQAQLAKWGDQHHPDLSGDAGSQCDARDMFAEYAQNYRDINAGNFDPRDPDRRLDWTGILLEEVYEALAESDPAKLRTELIQSAAVIAAWIADLDSRTVATPAGGLDG